jgi:hypothetical protein
VNPHKKGGCPAAPLIDPPRPSVTERSESLAPAGISEPTDNKPSQEKKPYLHRWGVIVSIAGICVTVIGIIVTSIWAYANYRHKDSTPSSAQGGPNSGLPSVSAPESSQPSSNDGTRGYVNSTIDGGWGPDRPKFTMNDPSPRATLNSIVDELSWGDTRQFVQCNVAGRPAGAAGSAIAVDGASIVDVTVWIENSSTKPGQDIKNARMRLDLPTGPVDDPGIEVTISGDAAAVPSVTAGCKLYGRQKMVVALDPASGKGDLSGGGAGKYVNDVPISDDVLRGDEPLPAVDGKPPGVIPANAWAYGILRFSLLIQPAENSIGSR